jgi:hypothetical protein
MGLLMMVQINSPTDTIQRRERIAVVTPLAMLELSRRINHGRSVSRLRLIKSGCH